MNGAFLTPSIPQPLKCPGRKVHIYTPLSSIFDGPVTNLLSMLCILTEILSRAHTKGAESHNGFKSGTFIGRFRVDGAASMAVKGLIQHAVVMC